MRIAALPLAISQILVVALAARAMADTRVDASVLDTIEVRAQKRVQSLEDVPVSMQVLSGDELAAQNVKDTAGLGGQVVNAKITQNTAEGTAPAITIRGVGNLDYNTSTTSPIGVYEDGVGGGTANRQLINLYDIESVEVLRGPQGTLFGRNTTGGALLINTRKPEFEPSAQVNLGVGNYDLRRFGGAFNLPLSPDVAVRLALDDQRYDHSVNNLYQPAPRPDMHQRQARLSMAANFEPVEIYLKLQSVNWRGVSKPVRHIGVIGTQASATQAAVLCEPLNAGFSPCTDLLGFSVPSDDLNVVQVNSDAFGGSPHHTDSWGADLSLKFPIDARSYVVAVSSFNDLDKQHFYNADASPARLVEGSLQVSGQLRTHELRYHFEGDQSYFIAGLYSLREPLSQDFFIDLFRDFRSTDSLFGSAALIRYDNSIRTRSDAAYLNWDYQLSDATTLTAGLRYTREQVDYRAIGTVNIAAQTNDQTGSNFPGWDVAGKVEDNNVSGKIALNHRFSPQFNAWFSLARGFKSGGYNGGIAFSAEEAQRNAYGSETLDALEAGARWWWNQRRASAQWSLFYYDYQDQQVFMNTASLVSGAPPLQLLDNVGESTIYGSEFEVYFQHSDAWQTRWGVGWLPKAALEEFRVAGGLVRGNRLPFTSKWNANGFLDYNRDIAGGTLRFQLNANFQSEFYFDQNQNAFTRQGAYTLFNSHIAFEKGDWRATLWGKNLTDHRYSHLRFDLINFLGLVQDNRGERRQLGIDFSYRF